MNAGPTPRPEPGRAADLLYGFLFLIALLAVLLGLAHITRFRALSEDERTFGFSGSVKGRLFQAPFAAGHFSVGASGSLRLNLDNFSQETYQLILRSVPAEPNTPNRFEVPPGLTKLHLRPGRGPAYVEFRWNRLPRGVVLNTVQSSEFRRFRQLMLLMLIVASAATLLYFVSGVRERTRGTRRAAVCVFFLFFAAYFQVFDDALIPLTGDEPHYLVLSESLLRDGDLLVENNYASVWRNLFYPDNIDRHTTPTENGDVASHYPLLSILLAPAMLGPAFGFQVSPYATGKLIVILLASLTAAFVFARVIRRTRKGTPRFVAGILAIVGFSGLPFLAYSNQIFPELVAGVLLFAIVSGLYDRSLRPPRPGRPFPGGGLFRMTLPIILLPWANLKFALPALLCGLYVLWLSRGVPRRLWFTSLFLGMGALSIALFTFANYGEALGPYAPKEIVGRDFFTRYATYLFDADRGIFALNPLLLWSLPGVAVFWRRSAAFALFLIAVIFAGHLPNIFQADERDWLLGYCPAGRYWIAVFPLLVWSGARGAAAMARWPRTNPVVRVLRGTVILLSLPGFLIGVLQSRTFLANQEAFYLPLRQPGNTARYLLETWHLDLTPIFARAPFTGSPALEAWSLAALLFVLLGISISRRSRKKERLWNDEQAGT